MSEDTAAEQQREAEIREVVERNREHSVDEDCNCYWYADSLEYLLDQLDESRAREAALREAGLALFDHAEGILGNSSEVYVLIQDMEALRALLLDGGAADARPGSSSSGSEPEANEAQR